MGHLLAPLIGPCQPLSPVTTPKSEPRPIAQTLWTAPADPTVCAEFLRLLGELSALEREQVARLCSEKAKAPLKDLLRPYETQVSRETIQRTLG